MPIWRMETYQESLISLWEEFEYVCQGLRYTILLSRCTLSSIVFKMALPSSRLKTEKKKSPVFGESSHNLTLKVLIDCFY